jgi:hypothetical protein
MAHRAARLLTGFFVVALLLALAALVFALSQPKFAPPPLPNPNGYDELVQAGRMVSEDAGDFATMNDEDLRTLVRTNAETLRLTRMALSHACQVPLDYSPANSVLLPELAGFKRLAYALSAEGRVAEMENRPGDAAEAYLTTIRLGQAVGHGGLIIHSLVGVAIEAIGTRGLENLLPNLDAKQCREAAAVVETCAAHHEQAAEVLAREKAWARRVFGLKGQVVRLFAYRSLQQNEQRAGAKLTANKARLQTLLSALAAQAGGLNETSQPRRDEPTNSTDAPRAKP